MIASNVEVGNWLSKQGAQKVTAFNTGGSSEFAFGTVKLTLAFHSSSMPDGSYGGSPNGMVIRFNDGPTVHHCGDTALFSDMQLIAEEDIDLALVPIGDFYTMGVQDSIRAIQYLRPRYVIPIHYNTWPPLTQDAGQWAQLVANETDAQPLVLDPGGSHDF
jgi:L-ascorbate metabolism protein UlaG (beta-lactamase superfamily)